MSVWRLYGTAALVLRAIGSMNDQRTARPNVGSILLETL